MIRKIWYRLFPNWEDFRYTRGEWGIKVITDLFGNYNETKYCHFTIEYSKRLNKYRLETSGYKPLEHKLYSILYNEVIRLNSNNEENK